MCLLADILLIRRKTIFNLSINIDLNWFFRVSDVTHGPFDLFCCRSCSFSQYFILPILVGADAMKAVTIGLRNLSSWQWTNGEQFSIVHPHLTASLNSYDGNMDPCVFNFCGLFTTVSLTDLNIFDNCCHNVMSSFACFTKAFTWIGQELRGHKVLKRN